MAIGSPLLDVIGMASEAQLAQAGLEKGSMTLVDLVKANAVQAAMVAPRFVSGGSVANTVAGIAELGGQSGFVGAVADDEVGRTYTENLRAAGVEFEPSVSESAAGDGLGTGRCIVLITDDADRTMGTYLGAASTLSPEGVSTPFVARASVVLLEGYLWDVPAAKDAMRHAAVTAHGSEGSVALSLSDPFCVERHQREFLDLLVDDIDILLGNEEEVTMLFGASSYSGALEAAEETGLLVVMTRGAQGATVLTARGPEEVPAAPVERVLDTTGAGDLFAAGMLFGLTHGMGPVESTSLGGLCAAEVISHTGARPRPISRCWRRPPDCYRPRPHREPLHRDRWAAQRGQVDAFQCAHPNEVLAANYPFATIDPNVGVVAVPDARLEVLSVMYEGAPVVPATVTFVDIAGLVRGASQGEGLGNKFLASIRETDAICQVVRAFHDEDVVHVDARVDPMGDIETVNTELILADLQTVENRLPKLVKETKTTPALRPTLEAVEAAQVILGAGPDDLGCGGGRGAGRRLARATSTCSRPSPSSTSSTSRRARWVTRGWWPVECQHGAGRRRSCCAPRSRPRWPGSRSTRPRSCWAATGRRNQASSNWCTSGFATLGLQTYLTAGPKEARAWTIHVGDTAPKAAGVIHTDFERGFIKAEVISFEDLDSSGSVAAAHAAGKARMEGKDYVMRDGDVVEFRFNT